MIRIAVRARPGARRERVVLHDDAGLEVQVRAPAVDGRANQAVLAAIADALGLRGRAVRLVRGERARDKLVEVDLSGLDELRSRLAAGSADRRKP